MGSQYRRLLWLILGVALALRLAFALSLDPLAPYASRGGDSNWYLGNAYALITGRSPEGMVTDVSHLTSPPVYFVVIGVPQALLSPAAAIIAIRIFQALLSTATCYFAYRLALRLTGRESAGLLAALALALSPVFIVESAQILTETVFIFLVSAGVWLYVEYVHRVAPQMSPRRAIIYLILAAVCLGLATLTRAVLLAFPFGLALHLLLARGWRKGWRSAALLLLVYALIVSTWTVYNLARWNRFVIAGEGLPAFFYLGAAGWTSPQEVDQSLAQQSPSGDYVEGAQNVIGSDPLGWVKRRVTELAEAYLQPHGTTFYPGESLRDLALGWLRGLQPHGTTFYVGESLRDLALGWLHRQSSLSDLVQGEGFWAKLALYLMHYTALVAGLVGMWLYRRRWRAALPMIGFIAYLTLVHLFLLALPRYLFPAEVFWWVFASATISHGFSSSQSHKQ